jgi:hypothetical protein
MAHVQIYQIFYNDETARTIDRHFIALDNTTNERPDWREYWPMRRFLLSAPLDDSAFYGFLSPKFVQKTLLSPQTVLQFASECRPHYDLVSFSPHPDQHGLFWNIFHQADWFHPGFIGASQQILDRLGYSFRLNEIIMDARSAVFSNYFVAKPIFWRPWLEMNERIFALGEDPSSALGKKLNEPCPYGDQSIPLKVFLMERTASLVLSLNPKLKSTVYRAFQRPLSKVVEHLGLEAIIGDALKRAVNDTGEESYKIAATAFFKMVKTRLPSQLG